MYGLERLTYLCLKGDTHTDFYTAFATEELRATPPTVLCSVSLSITVYTKTRNPAALVFIPICAGRRAGMRILMTLTLHLPAADAALIRQYATEKGLSVSKLIRHCVLERIEDEFDLETYRKSLEAYKTLPSTYTLDEVESEILNSPR